jgi:hypothetical protein
MTDPTTMDTFLEWTAGWPAEAKDWYEAYGPDGLELTTLEVDENDEGAFWATLVKATDDTPPEVIEHLNTVAESSEDESGWYLDQVLIPPWATEEQRLLMIEATLFDALLADEDARNAAVAENLRAVAASMLKYVPTWTRIMEAEIPGLGKVGIAEDEDGNWDGYVFVAAHAWPVLKAEGFELSADGYVPLSVALEDDKDEMPEEEYLDLLRASTAKEAHRLLGLIHASEAYQPEVAAS